MAQKGHSNIFQISAEKTFQAWQKKINGIFEIFEYKNVKYEIWKFGLEFRVGWMFLNQVKIYDSQYN